MDSRHAEEWRQAPSLLASVWRFRWLVAAVALLGALGGYFYSTQQVTLYSATARVLLRDPRVGATLGQQQIGWMDPARYVRNQAEVMTSAPVLRRASESLAGVLSVEELRGVVAARSSPELDLVVVQAIDLQADGAAAIANAVARAYEAVVRDEVIAAANRTIAELEASRQELEASLASAETRLEADPRDPVAAAERDAAAQQLAEVVARSRQIAVDAALFGGPVELLEEAEPPRGPLQPRPVRSTATGFVLAFLAAAGFAWWRNSREPEEDLRSRVERILQAPLLGEVPALEHVDAAFVPTVSNPHSAGSEAYQFVMAALGSALRNVGSSSVLVTSAEAGEGKTSTCINLAVAASRGRRSVLLVDADARARGLRRLLSRDIEQLPHLDDDGTAIDVALRTWRPAQGVEVDLLALGDPAGEPSSFFGSTAFQSIMRGLRGRADLVLVDSPPLLAVADAFEIAEHAEAVLLVVTPETPERLLEEMQRRLAVIRTPVIGFVLNRSDAATSPYRYGYETEDARDTRPPLWRGRRRSSNGKRPDGWSSPPARQPQAAGRR